jgi:tRNA modification GTPase
MSLPPAADPPKSNVRHVECALLSGAGRSAIAVIGVRGRDAAAVIDHCFTATTDKRLDPGQIRYGTWLSSEDRQIASEHLVVTPITAESFEIHCHGGPAAIERILGDLSRYGATRIDSFAWDLDRSLLIGEARRVLAECLTARTAAIAMDQVRGALADWVTHWSDQLRERQGPTPELEKLRAAATVITGLANWTSRLAEPFRVVLLGPPNVGKSSLINAIVGYDRSITFDQPGTTRDVIQAETVIAGLPIQLSDTAGIRASAGGIEREGIARARTAAQRADLVLLVSAANESAAHEFGVSEPFSVGQWKNPPATLRVLNKSDLLPKGQNRPPRSLLTTATTGEGIPALLAAIATQLVPNPPQAGDPVAINRRQARLIQKLSLVPSAADATQLLSELWCPSG